jgi:8-oxo-dGTP pyrophosphatase MutT (NUDIX family)
VQDAALELQALAGGELPESLEPLRGGLFARPTPLSVGDAAVIDEQGRILLMQRADDATWAMPGGALEVGETPAEGALREVWEETGVRCRALALAGVYDSRLCGLRTRQQLYVLNFLCCPIEVPPGSHEGLETLATGWFSEDALPEPLHHGHEARIRVAYALWRGERAAWFDRDEGAPG